MITTYDILNVQKPVEYLGWKPLCCHYPKPKNIAYYYYSQKVVNDEIRMIQESFFLSRMNECSSIGDWLNISYSPLFVNIRISIHKTASMIFSLRCQFKNFTQYKTFAVFFIKILICVNNWKFDYLPNLWISKFWPFMNN